MNKKYLLKLYISGATPRSVRAVNNIKAICRKYLNGDYELHIIDVYDEPHLAKGGGIIVFPTLVRILPLPEKKIVGDLVDTEMVWADLEIN